MGYSNFSQCLADLERSGDLIRIEREVDPFLEAGAIQRRVYHNRGPALLFCNVKGSSFPMAANVFGKKERIRFIFRDSLPVLETVFAAKADPSSIIKNIPSSLKACASLMHALPRFVSTGPVLDREVRISDLPQLVSWPQDGGAYVTLPQVYSEDINRPGIRGSNLGMYRIQLSGSDFVPDAEIGLHYQIHRGIGHHHLAALESGKPFRVNIFVGGPPAMTFAAVMPLPDGMPEIYFAGLLGGRRVEMVRPDGFLPVPAQADFCICGVVQKRELPEGPFGDHLGYYSLKHDFPVMTVEKVFCRKDAVWPFTTVGRPPQEDTEFGSFIHELTSDLIPTVFSGVKEVHAVDEAGVHPLLLAIGSERYVPYSSVKKPQELLTCAMSLLGSTQTSLSKYVIIADQGDDRELSTRNIPAFLRHILERIDLTRDLHFFTRTTIDTLDYSGISLNQGSKLIMAANGPARRTLGAELSGTARLADGFSDLLLFRPGILVLKGPKHTAKRDSHDPLMFELCNSLHGQIDSSRFPLVVVADDAVFAAESWRNFLWVTFTRSDPATDIYGVDSFVNCKHWGCLGSMVIDARLKSYHAPPLEDDPVIEKRVDQLGAPGGPLHGVI